MGNYKNLKIPVPRNTTNSSTSMCAQRFFSRRHVVPVMLAQASGTILMISSMAGVYGLGGESVYCMTKFAQVGFAQALDRELRPGGIKVGVTVLEV